MTTILLVRHGETDWNRARRWQGHADPPLNELGRSQARELADRLAGESVDAVWSSDLVRARETAAIVAERLGLPVSVDPRLREVDVGEWSGLTMAEIELRFPDGLRRRQEGGTGWEHGESYEAMAERVVAALRAIAERHDGGRVVVVTHGGAMREVWHACGGPPDQRPHVRNCDVHVVEVADGRLSLGGDAGAPG